MKRIDHNVRYGPLGVRMGAQGFEVAFGESLRLRTMLTSVSYGPDTHGARDGFWLDFDGATWRGVPADSITVDVEGRIAIRGSNDRLETTLDIGPGPEPGMLTMDMALTPATDIDLVRLHLAFAVHLELRGAWLPNLLYKKGRVVGDHVFRSPAALMWGTGFGIALIPDPAALHDDPIRTAIDFRNRHPRFGGPYLAYGFTGYGAQGNTYYPERTVRAESKKTHRTRLYLLVGRLSRRRLFRTVNAFFHRHYLAEGMRNDFPQALPLKQYCRAGMRYVYDSGLWIEAKGADPPCGGTTTFDFASENVPETMGRAGTALFRSSPHLISLFQTRIIPALLNSDRFLERFERFIHAGNVKRLPLVSFTTWFNHLRTAYGAMAWGARWKDERLQQKAQAVLNLVLSAPDENGALPCSCYLPAGKPSWVRGSRGFTYATGAYNTADMATTLGWMLTWRQDFGGPEGLDEKIKQACTVLRAAQLDSGAVPSWFKVRGGRPAARPELAESATTAAAVELFARYAFYTQKEAWLDAAKRGADFLADRVIAPGTYQDFETFYSCSRKPLDSVDPLTGIRPENNLAMYWTAAAMLALYQATGSMRYLDLGRESLDRLSLYQQVHNVAHVNINTLGGFGVMNSDGEWNDARQAVFAPLYLRYYQATGRAEDFDRGRAALAASFVCMLVPQNRRLAPGHPETFPERCHGAVYENFAHFGSNIRTPGYIEPDWGAGTACTAAAEILRDFGGLYVDLERDCAFGLDGCEVRRMERRADATILSVRDFLGTKRPLDVVVHNPKAEQGELFVDDRSLGRITGETLQRLVVQLPLTTEEA